MAQTKIRTLTLTHLGVAWVTAELPQSAGPLRSREHEAHTRHVHAAKHLIDSLSAPISINATFPCYTFE